MTAITNNKAQHSEFIEAAKRGDISTLESLFKSMPSSIQRLALSHAQGRAKPYLIRKLYPAITLPPVRPEPNDFEAPRQADMDDTGETGSLTRFEQVMTIVILSAAIFFIRT